MNEPLDLADALEWALERARLTRERIIYDILTQPQSSQDTQQEKT